MSNPRFKEPYSNDPPDTLTDERLLCLMLEYCEKDPMEASQKLLSRYGNLANVLDATAGDLVSDRILSESGISLLRLVSESHRRYLFIRSGNDVRLLDHTAIAEYLSPFFAGVAEETVFLLSLDHSKQILGCSRLSHGDIGATQLPLRGLVKEALLRKAAYVVLAHNHPSGIRAPSQEDIHSTLALQELLQPLDICLLDHMIFTDSGYCSLVECGYFRP